MELKRYWFKKKIKVCVVYNQDNENSQISVSESY